ncbi:MAG: HEAT repeat domain-containing protein, partial [Myxococcota bacterium]
IAGHLGQKRDGNAHPFARAGALRALAATRRSEVLDDLVAMLAPAAAPSWAVRPHAAGAIGALLRQLEGRAKERAREALVDALRDEVPRVRAAAAAALVAGKAREAGAALDAYRTTLPFQDQVRLDRQRRGLARGDGGLRDAEKRIEKLEDQLRRLEDQLRQVEARRD